MRSLEEIIYIIYSDDSVVNISLASARCDGGPRRPLSRRGEEARRARAPSYEEQESSSFFHSKAHFFMWGRESMSFVYLHSVESYSLQFHDRCVSYNDTFYPTNFTPIYIHTI